MVGSPASTEEMLQAKLDYDVSSKGAQAAHTIESALDLIRHWIQVGKLDDASSQMNKLQSTLPLRDTRLSQLVEEALGELSEAYYIRADMYDRRGDYSVAVRDYQVATSLDADNREALNSFSWLCSTCPNEELRDASVALRSATKACELTNWKQWRYLSTLAAACAQNSRFADAIDYQKRALSLLPHDEQDRWKVNLELRLSSFNLGKSYDKKQFLHVPTENLVGWWKFDDAGNGIARDASGNNHHGQVTGHPKRQPGKIGSCIQLDGDDDRINCGSNDVFNINDAVTFTFWIKISGPHGSPPNTVAKSDNSWRIGISGKGKINFDCYGLDTGDASFDGIRSTKIVYDDHWHHVVGVYDGSRFLIYIDGVLDSSAAATGTITHNESDLQMGWSCQCLLDDMRIYNRALSAGEIAELFSSAQ